MSLSERAKGALRQAIEGPKEMLGPRAEEVMLKLGPVAIVDHIISNTVIPEASAALSENREEAEQYVAGLLSPAECLSVQRLSLTLCRLDFQ